MTSTLPKPTDDGLIKNKVKSHSRDKHHPLQAYMTAFTNAMYDKWSLFYVDLFCGSGIDEIEDFGLDWGSPLIAAQMSKQFRRLLLNDKDAKNSLPLRRGLNHTLKHMSL